MTKTTKKCKKRTPSHPISSGFGLPRWPHGAKHHHHALSPSFVFQVATRSLGCDALRCHHARDVELDTRRGRSRSSWRHDQRINSAEPPFCCVDERDGWKQTTTAALGLAPLPLRWSVDATARLASSRRWVRDLTASPNMSAGQSKPPWSPPSLRPLQSWMAGE